MALAFLAGILCIETREALTPLAIAGSPLAAALVACLCWRPRLVAALLAGAAWSWWRAALLLAAQLDPALEGQDLLIVGEVVSLPQTGAGRVQFDFEPVSSRRLPDRVRLTWYEPQRAPRAGESWQLEVRLRARRGFANPGAFDYEGQLFRERIGATGWIRSSDHNRLLGSSSASLLLLRAAIVERMAAVLEGTPAAGVLIGLAVGATHGIEPHQWQVFFATGTTHLIAISGLHVTMIAALAMWLSGGCWRWWPVKPRWARADVASLFGVLAASGYSLLAGLSIPTQRTLLMLVAALAAGWLRRSQPASNVLGLALIAVLVVDPHAVLAPGFWLSFVAVAALLMLVREPGGLATRVREFLKAQAAVTMLLLPATIMLFGSVSIVAPVVNLLAIPLFTALLVPATLSGLVLLALVPPVGAPVLELTAAVFDSCWPLLELAAGAPGALFFPAGPDWLLISALALAALGALSVFPPRLGALGLVLLLPLAFPARHVPLAGGVDVTVLDVGHGLAVLLRTRSHALLYDAGPRFRSGRSAGELAVLPYLRHEGIRKLDMLVISHEDADHAGGVAAVATSMPITSVRHGGGSVDIPVPQAPCLRGEAWNWDGVHFEFLHPRAGEHWDDNDGSCVLRVAARGGGVLLAGDIEREVEQRLARDNVLLPVDVVVIPHHGSRSSSTHEFIEASRARYAIASAGHRNRWGLPHGDVVERWCAAGTLVLDTASWGAVSVAIDGERQVGTPRGHRARYRRFWHAGSGVAIQPRCGASARRGQ